MPTIEYPSFAVDVPDDWEDVTDSVEVEDPPFTLNRLDGVGALQFSVGLYSGGAKPDPSPDDLLRMLVDLAESRGLGPPMTVTTQSVPLRLAAGSFRSDGDFVRVWYVSDGWSVALVTYLCEWDLEASELVICEQIVRSLVFKPRPAQ
jgi:hypothetical protein